MEKGNQMQLYASYKKLTSETRHIQTEREGLEEDISCKGKQKHAEVAICAREETDFK